MFRRNEIMAFMIVVLLATGCKSKGNVKTTPTLFYTPTPLPPTLTSTATIIPFATASLTDTPTPMATSTPKANSTPMANGTPTVAHSPTPKPPTSTLTMILKPTIPPESRLNLQCLEVEPTLPSKVVSTDIVVLGRGVGEKQRHEDVLLLDMATGKSTKIVTQNENQNQHLESPNHKYIAYVSSTFDTQGNFLKDELVIASRGGQRLKTIEWEQNWDAILRWTNDQHLVISYDMPVLSANGEQKTVRTYLVLDPFSGKQQLLEPNLPGIIDTAELPFWGGWYGIVYAPTLTRAIYPRVIESNEDLFTFAIWNVKTGQIVNTLENIYTEGTSFAQAAPMPVWSSDGSYFVINGQILTPEEQVEFELYRVSRDGKVDQLTHLSSVAILKGVMFSISPDNRKIAMYLDTWYDIKESRVAVLDLETLTVTDYCIPIRGISNQPPVWSPDSTQFLVTDQYDNEHRRVILVDIAQNLATQIAEDMDPIAWMVSP